MKAMYEWLGKHTRAWYGPYLFGLLVFIEGFFIVPVSTLLAFFSLQNQQKSFLYALIATLVSALGASVGYFLGTLLWQMGGEAFITYIVSPETFERLIQQFKTYQAWTTFFIALTPLPYKVLTLTAGFMGLPFLTFVLLSMLARGIRFFIIAGTIYLWGDKVNYYLNRYFYPIIITGISLLFLIWYFMH
jgi:membrane protein YqaA with SNARE-associated domain